MWWKFLAELELWWLDQQLYESQLLVLLPLVIFLLILIVCILIVYTILKVVIQSYREYTERYLL